MGRRVSIILLVFCFGLSFVGCPKKVVKTDEGAATSREEAATAAARERAAKEAAEREKAGTAAKEAARIKEEETKKAQAEKQAEKQRKEFEKSLVAKQEPPGIEGKVFDSTLLKDLHFDYDKYDIRPADAEILKENAAHLMKNPKVKIQIEGHCDERGTAEYNLALGERRANSVKKYLDSLGVAKDRLSTISYGKEMPLDPSHNEEAWAKNRRAHFAIISK